MNKTVKRLYEFGPFILDPGERLLRHGASRMELPPRAFDTLQALVENNGRLLEKDALMQTVWGDTIVEENNLSQVIYLLRKALRDGEDGSRYIETVPKRGYRFTAEVREFEPEPAESIARISASPSPQDLPSNHRESPLPPQTAVMAISAAAPPPPSPVGANGNGDHRLHKASRRGWIHGLVGGLAIIAMAVLLPAANWKQKLFDRADAAPVRSLAVLPLQNLSNDPNQEYFVDGMTDELITDLAQIRELKVVSKTSIMQYKGTRIPLPQIGHELGVDAVVEGSVLRSGDRVRITAQLIRTATDHHIWAAAYDGDLKDILSLQARVAESITDQVKLNLTAEESGRLRRSHAVDPQAFDLYLRGRYAWNQRNLESFHTAVQYFHQAIDRDSNFALAYSGLADSDILLALYGEGHTKVTEAKQAAEKALQLDDTLAEAHTSLAAVRILDAWDWQNAELEFQRALQLNPNYAQAHHWYGNLLLGPEGRNQEAMAELQRAQELDPLSTIIMADAGFAYYLAGRYDLALPIYQKVLAANPDFVPVHFYLSQYYRQTGQYDLWIKEIVEDYRLTGLTSLAESMQRLYAEGGFQGVLEEGTRNSSPAKIAPYQDVRLNSCYAAQANALLGRIPAALTALDTCSRGAPLALIYLKVDPVWANLRRERGFQDLLRRFNLQ